MHDPCHPCRCTQALIDGKVLCVHGGLSPDIRTLDQVRLQFLRVVGPPGEACTRACVRPALLMMMNVILAELCVCVS